VKWSFAALSIRAKLMTIFVLTTGIALVMSGLAFLAYDLLTYRQQRLNDVTSQAELLASLSAAALTFDDPEAAAEYLGALRARPRVVEAATYQAQGRVFATYRRQGEPAGEPPSVEPPGQRVERDEVLVFRPIHSGSDLVGTIFMRAQMGIAERLTRYLIIMLAVFAASMLVAVLLLVRMQVLITGPLLEVTAVAHGVVQRGDHSQRVVKRTEDEVGVLVDAFNQMLSGIEQREASLQSEIAHHKEARDELAVLARELEARVAERTAELANANRELEAFSYSVSHDLRAPLRSIDGFTHILQTEHAEKLDEKGKQYMERVRAATERMGALIDDLLKLSRSVRAELVRKVFDMSSLARQVAGELQATAPGRDVVFSIEPGLVVDADPALMRTVLENLLGNAFKFTSKVPRALIEVGRVQVDGDTAYFVRDNGTGFDMRYVDKLFGAFQRLHPAAEYEGTGIGLANVQRIIRRHGGRIWAEAEVGKGATFTFTLT
jgi:signal transduction histidine kinase